MDDETITEIVDQLDDGQKKLLRLAGALPKEIGEQYELDSGDVADLVKAVQEE
jgi:hypothetical protein